MRNPEHNPEFYSRSAMNPMLFETSAVRNQMTDGFRSQSLVTTGATPKYHYTGVEDEMGKYTFSIRFPCNAEIYQVIHKDTETRDLRTSKNPTTIIIFRDIDKDIFDFIEVPKYHCMHQYYGYVYKKDMKEYNRALVPGNMIAKGTIIANSPTIADDGTNMYLIETMRCNVTMPEVTEDGCIASIEYLNENKVFCVERRVLRFGGNEFLLNMHGKDGKYAGIPAIGDRIPASGLVFASRRINNSEEDKFLSPVLLHPSFLQTLEHGDTPVYGRPDAMVTDVRILRGRNERANYPSLFDEQVWELHRRGYDFHQRIHGVETALTKRYGEHLKYSKRLSRLFLDSYAEIMGSGIHKKAMHNIVHEKLVVNNWFAMVEFCYWITPDIGFKIADEQGCKHIIVAKKPRAEMPIDTDGNIADIVADPQGVMARNNVSQYLIMYINGASKRVGMRVKELVEQNKVNEAWEHLFDYYKLITDQVIPMIEDCRYSKEEEVRDVLRLGTARPFIPLDNNTWDNYFELVNAIREKFRPCLGPISYRGNSGRWVTTKRDILIASLPTMFLEKDGRDGTAVGSSRLHGTFALPTKPTSLADKVALPGKESPVKIFAETEKRLTSAACGGKGMRIIDEYNGNVSAHREVMKAIYNAGQPTAIYEAVDWNKVKMTGGRMVKFLHTMFRASGIELVESTH